tara:strand:- start:3342 stop:3755 length:414 start_codon:yes stop_codon:yes gene_type:complete
MGWFSDFKDEYIDPIVDNPVGEFVGEVLLGVDNDESKKSNEDKIDEIYSFMEAQLEEDSKISAARVKASAGDTSVPKINLSKELRATDYANMQVPLGQKVDFKLLQENAKRQKRLYSLEQFLISSDKYNSKYKREKV